MAKLWVLLKNPHFRTFIGANALLDLGKKLSWIALSWFVYQVTGSVLSIGVVISTATIAPLLSSLLVGGMLDRFNRRTLMAVDNLLRGLIMSLIPVMYWLDLLTFPLIVGVVFVNGFLSSFTSIGAQTIIPSFVEGEDLQSANALSGMISQAGYFLGPAIGGLCTAAFGAPMTLLLNVGCFVLAALLVWSIPDEVFNRGAKREAASRSISDNIRKIGQDTKEGVRFIVQYKSLIMMASVTFFFNLTYAPLETMLPVYVSDVLMEGSDVLGVMWSFFAVGTFLGSMLWLRVKQKAYYSFVLGGVIVLWGLASVGIGLSHVKMLAFLVMFAGGVVYAPYNIVAPTLRQSLVPAELRGRVFSVLGLLSGLGMPIGAYLGGVLGSWIGVVPTIVAGGVACVVLGMVVCAHPALRFKEARVLEIDAGSVKVA